jgi:hypothetical protein
MSYVQKGEARSVYIRQNEGSLMDVERADMVEKQLGAMIQRRARKGDVDPDEREELWKASVRRYHARREEELRAAWCGHHQEQAARLKSVLEGLISRHEAEAERYLARREHDSNAEEICEEEVEGAGQRAQERNAAPPDEGQEGRRDRQGPTQGHRRSMEMSENLADLAVRPNATAQPCRR